MPVQYEGVSAEHLAVRSASGVFDVSHMGEIETEGPGALDLLQRLLSNDVAKLDVGGAQYSVLCREDGGVLDDLFTYRLSDDRYLTVTNAANHERDLACFRDHGGEFDCEVRDRLADWAMLAVQGPMHVESWPPSPRASFHRGCRPGRSRSRARTAWSAARATRARTGWRSCARRTRRGAVDRGYRSRRRARRPRRPRHAAARGLLPPLRQRPLEDRNPIEAGLGWCCKEETGFIGSEQIAAARAQGTAQKLAPFVITGRGIPRQGNAVIDPDGAEAGVVTSGTHSPSLERGIGMAYVDSPLAEPGTAVEIDVRGERRAARA